MVKVAGGAATREFLQRIYKNFSNSKDEEVKLQTRRSINDVTNITRRKNNGKAF